MTLKTMVDQLKKETLSEPLTMLNKTITEVPPEGMAPIEATIVTPYKKKYDNAMVMKIAADLLTANVAKHGLPDNTGLGTIMCAKSIQLAKQFIDEMGL